MGSFRGNVCESKNFTVRFNVINSYNRCLYLQWTSVILTKINSRAPQ